MDSKTKFPVFAEERTIDDDDHFVSTIDLDVEGLSAHSPVTDNGHTITGTSSATQSLPRRSKDFFLPIPSRVQQSDDIVGLKTAASRFEGSGPSRRRAFLDAARYPRNPSSTGDISSTRKTIPIEEDEEHVRAIQIKNPLFLLVLGFIAAFKVMFIYLITLETILSCGLSVGLTIYWYDYGTTHEGWNGGSMNYVILAFAVTSPIAATIGMAFTRREAALLYIADFRANAHQLYLAHSLWDWSGDGGRKGSKMDLRAHSDAVMAQLVGIGDELARFLTLPTTSRSIHRMTRLGRFEAAATVEVAYRLLESMTSHRMTRLCVYGERIKAAGLPAGELSRIRQYERFLEDSVERLRLIKMYRTPQAFRSFARIFTFFLPPFYAPTYAQVAIDTQSLGMGIAFGIVTALGLTALFESLQVLEDPFVGDLALDGIDVREEFQVLLWTSLVNTRRGIFPDAPPYPIHRRRAIEIIHDTGDRDERKNEGYPPSIGDLVVKQSLHHDARSQRGDDSVFSLSTEGGGKTLVSGNRSNDSDEGKGHGGASPSKLKDVHIAESVEFGYPWDDGARGYALDAGRGSVHSGIRESKFKKDDLSRHLQRRGIEPTSAFIPFAASSTSPSHRRTKTG